MYNILNTIKALKEENGLTHNTRLFGLVGKKDLQNQAEAKQMEERHVSTNCKETAQTLEGWGRIVGTTKPVWMGSTANAPDAPWYPASQKLHRYLAANNFNNEKIFTIDMDAKLKRQNYHNGTWNDYTRMKRLTNIINYMRGRNITRPPFLMPVDYVNEPTIKDTVPGSTSAQPKRHTVPNKLSPWRFTNKERKIKRATRLNKAVNDSWNNTHKQLFNMQNEQNKKRPSNGPKRQTAHLLQNQPVTNRRNRKPHLPMTTMSKERKYQQTQRNRNQNRNPPRKAST